MSARGYPLGLRAGKDPRSPIIVVDGGFEKVIKNKQVKISNKNIFFSSWNSLKFRMVWIESRYGVVVIQLVASNS